MMFQASWTFFFWGGGGREGKYLWIIKTYLLQSIVREDLFHECPFLHFEILEQKACYFKHSVLTVTWFSRPALLTDK